MGESTLTNSANSIPIKQSLRPVRLQFDVPLLLAVITLVIFGLLMVYSASWEFSVSQRGYPSYVLIKQIGFALAGAVIAMIASRVNYHLYQKWAFVLLVISLMALVAVLVINRALLRELWYLIQFNPQNWRN
jgi:cell division protein FtsW